MASNHNADRKRIPLIHVTDLYHPPQDPDDQFDLATALALPELDLRAVILDTTEKFLRSAPTGWDVARDPGLVIVAQAGWLSGRAIPVAVGPTIPLRDSTDTAEDRPAREQAGVTLLLQTLAESAEPVVISVVGSLRVVTAAFNRDPELLRRQVRAVLVNAGTTVVRELEWNVQLDPAAFIGLFRSGLPLHWFPCATESGAFDCEPERGTHWRARHEDLLRGLPAPWQGWFAYGLTGSARSDILNALPDLNSGSVWETLQPAERCLWSTASLVMAAGRTLIRTDVGWRFLPCDQATKSGGKVWPWRLDPIDARVDDDGQVRWKLIESATSTKLFGRRPGHSFSRAMTEALNALFRALPT